MENNQIADFKEITSENPIKQIWKLLRFFLDESSVSDMIREIHGIEKGGKQDANIRKDARQIGYCIRQAEEYFHASSQVDLPTRPLLLYYGVSSLAWALIILRKGGDYSFDKRRKDRKHKHHGLDLLGEVQPNNGLENFLDSLQCKCHIKEDETAQKDIPWGIDSLQCKRHIKEDEIVPKNIPWGTFPLFYESLVPCAFFMKSEKSLAGSNYVYEGDIVFNCADLQSVSDLVRRRFNSLELIRSLPDVYQNLMDLGIQPDLCEGRVSVTARLHAEGKKYTGTETFTYWIDRIGLEQRNRLPRLFELYRSRNPNIKIVEGTDPKEYPGIPSIHFTLTEELESQASYIPDIVDNLNGSKFYILEPEAYLPEPAAHFILLYRLGMLARYSPDKWMEAIDHDVMIAEFTDSLLNVIHRKFPNLILDQMRRTKHYIHI